MDVNKVKKKEDDSEPKELAKLVLIAKTSTLYTTAVCTHVVTAKFNCGHNSANCPAHLWGISSGGRGSHATRGKSNSCGRRHDNSIGHSKRT